MNILQDTTINGYDVSVYEQEDGLLTLDIKFPCGELIKGWEGIENFYTAERVANSYTLTLGNLTLGNYKKPHCGNEYCIDAFNNQEEIKP
jgi:hypothetical protein